LLNVAFEGGSPFWLLCPYDKSSLESSVLDAARHSHPYVTSGAQSVSPSELYPGVSAMSSLRRHDLSPVPDNAVRFSVTAATIGLARRDLQSLAIAFGLGRWATEDLASAAHEVIANSLSHGGGRGEVSIWLEEGFLICEVKDRGVFDRPMAGRIQPTTHGMGGRGLWMANQLCELVQIRSEPDVTVVRLHMALKSRSSGSR
jgi:anti-sigma regulatory factor (Ser/Thr protein kinase)